MYLPSFFGTSVSFHVFIILLGQSFLYLHDLDLSYNEITDVEDFPYKLGAITTLNLSGNRLRDVRGLDKMFSLKNLKISDNLIEKVCMYI